jgi:uncharacterized protein (TIGR00369 family)
MDLHDPMPPAAVLIGRRTLSRDGEFARIRFFAPPEFANRHGSVQGGLLGAMIDSATGWHFMADLPAGLTAVTTGLSVEFLKPAPLGEILAQARIVRRDERDGEVECALFAPDGEVVARGSARLRIRRRN